jgi:hypothetical protein
MALLLVGWLRFDHGRWLIAAAAAMDGGGGGFACADVVGCEERGEGRWGHK